MNLKILTALLLIGASPAFAAGICIVCPPGHDCSTGTPKPNGTTGQVLAKGATGIEWKTLAIPAPSADVPKALGTTGSQGTSDKYARGDHVHPKPTYTAADVGAVPTTRTIGGLALSEDISILQLSLLLAEVEQHYCHSSSTSSPTSATSSGQFCWCKLKYTVIMDRDISPKLAENMGSSGNCNSNCLTKCYRPEWRVPIAAAMQ